MKRVSNRESFGGWLNKDICLRFFWAIRSFKGTQSLRILSNLLRTCHG